MIQFIRRHILDFAHVIIIHRQANSACALQRLQQPASEIITPFYDHKLYYSCTFITLLIVVHLSVGAAHRKSLLA
ncbi:uncharacterized protein BO80DRAFT_257611 [Aspergillus ibericus CBS 121593]|uniref:Uncharacterized protein n=1 Tax=Aspergillus ibericus CBS 121593 TaxID=1448316 RepID=A0A395HB79_9EURO|nr:hypothetical protein BO80DRAFT_257611 [Aspergillus ibericus CBS 121593]RAL04188.1 hypothetical protein BO80DRAFT_257611 [Aspergillus ibericus CBS 121593]